MKGEEGPPALREDALPLRLALEEAADAIDRAVTALLEPGVADAAAAAGASPLLGVDCMWWSQQLRAAARKLEQAAG